MRKLYKRVFGKKNLSTGNSSEEAPLSEGDSAQLLILNPQVTEAVAREEKVPIISFRELGRKEVREERVAEALDFIPTALLSLISTYDEAYDTEIYQLLTHVAQGEQEQAEAMLKINPDLLLEKGTVTDLSKRTFTGIKAFQYALWALDWHMWKMLLKYLSEEAAATQFQELEDKGTAHGKQVSWQGLIDAYTEYMPFVQPAWKVNWSGAPMEALRRH